MLKTGAEESNYLNEKVSNRMCRSKLNEGNKYWRGEIHE